MNNQILFNPHHQEMGVIGEYRVFYELRRRGIKAVKLDDTEPFSIIILDGLKTVEVKTARKGYVRTDGRQYECYAFKLRAATSDFVICWAVDIDSFYIIPTTKLSSGMTRIYPTHPHWKEYENAWSLISETHGPTGSQAKSIQQKPGLGPVSDLMTLPQAAREIGVHFTTLYRWKKAGRFHCVRIGAYEYIPAGEVTRLKEEQLPGK